MAPLVKRFPRYQRHMVWVGWPICILGILAGSFMDTLPGLIMTQGVMYGGKFSLISHSKRLLTFYSWICSILLSHHKHGKRMVGCEAWPCMGNHS